MRKRRIRNKNYRKQSESEDDDPLAQYRKNIEANGQSMSVSNAAHFGQRTVWDGFQWVNKGNTIASIDSSSMSQTKKMRRVQISNLPLYLGINEDSIIKVVSDFLVRNYLNDPNNQTPIIHCELSRKDKTCVIELSSVEEANRFSKLKDISILNVSCKITRLGESMYGTTTNLALILQNANVSQT